MMPLMVMLCDDVIEATNNEINYALNYNFLFARKSDINVMT